MESLSTAPTSGVLDVQQPAFSAPFTDQTLPFSDAASFSGTASASLPSAGSPAPLREGADGSGAPWWQNLPQGFQEVMHDFADEGSALAALKRGAAYTPALRPEDIAVTWPKGVEVDTETHADFKAQCVASGITPQQAQQLVDWQWGVQSRQNVQAMAAGEEALQQRWGFRFAANRQAALGTLTALDRRMGGRLAPVLARSGVGNSPEMVEAFHLLSTIMGEDSLGSATTGAAPVVRETPEQAYAEMFK